MLHDDPRVDADVQSQRKASEEQLIATREAVRIEDWKNVMGDEVALVGCFSLLTAQTVFEGCQWADPAGELDEHSPDNRGDVQPAQARPPECQQTAQHDEDHERKVESDDQVGYFDFSSSIEARS
jgi:hypothetical protein